jgi:hypothetical protein
MMLIYSMTSTMCMLLMMAMNTMGMEGIDFLEKETESTNSDLEEIAERIGKKSCLDKYCLLIKNKFEKNGNDEKIEGVEKEKMIRSMLKLLKTFHQLKQMKSNQLYRI